TCPLRSPCPRTTGRVPRLVYASLVASERKLRMTTFHYDKFSFLWFDSPHYNTFVAACQYTAWCNNMLWRQGDKVIWQPRGQLYLSPDRMLHFVEENGTRAWSDRLYLPHMD